MNEHEWFAEKLPFYVNGQLSASEQAEVEAHLHECAACRQELAFWRSVSDEVIARESTLVVPEMDTSTLLLHAGKTPSLFAILRHGWELLLRQVPLVRRDMWPASLGMMAIGVAVAVVAEKTSVLYFLAPMIAAAMLALIYGAENDPASEVTMATATSPAMVLFARMTLVSAFNLALALTASLGVALFLPGVSFWTLVLTWLAPMAFLSMLTLFLSMWMGSGNAVLVTYGLWILQFIPLQRMRLFSALPAWMQKVTVLQDFWQNNLFLLIGTACLFVLVLVGTRFSTLSIKHQPV